MTDYTLSHIAVYLLHVCVFPSPSPTSSGSLTSWRAGRSQSLTAPVPPSAQHSNASGAGTRTPLSQQAEHKHASPSSHFLTTTQRITGAPESAGETGRDKGSHAQAGRPRQPQGARHGPRLAHHPHAVHT